MTGGHLCVVNRELCVCKWECTRSRVRQHLVLVQRTLVFVVFILVSAVVPAAVSQPIRHRRSPYYDNVMNYLTKFGYLPQSDIETGNLRTDEQLHEAIRTLQAFGNIPQTGKVDTATKSLMKKPRCGLPDLPDQDHTRKKRYAIHRGPKWHHTDLTWSLRSTHLGHLDHGQVRREFYKALDIWAQPSKLTFREVNSDDADILIYFHRGFHGDGYAFDGPGRILAHAFFPGSDRGGDVHFDEEETWLLSGESVDKEGVL